MLSKRSAQCADCASWADTAGAAAVLTGIRLLNTLQKIVPRIGFSGNEWRLVSSLESYLF